MRILHTADRHVGNRIGRYDRTDDYALCGAYDRWLGERGAGAVKVLAAHFMVHGTEPSEELLTAFRDVYATVSDASA